MKPNEALVKLLPALRENMTSITRYVKDDYSKHPNLTPGQWLDRNLKNKDLALEAVANILLLINENHDIRLAEKEAVEEVKIIRTIEKLLDDSCLMTKIEF